MTSAEYNEVRALLETLLKDRKVEVIEYPKKEVKVYENYRKLMIIFDNIVIIEIY